MATRSRRVSINPEEIGICKYKEMLMATVKDALEILGYGSSERIFHPIYLVSVVLFSRIYSHLIYLILTYHFERMTEPHSNAMYLCKTCKQMFFSYSKVVEHKSMIGHQEYEGEEKR